MALAPSDSPDQTTPVLHEIETHWNKNTYFVPFVSFANAPCGVGEEASGRWATFRTTPTVRPRTAIAGASPPLHSFEGPTSRVRLVGWAVHGSPSDEKKPRLGARCAGVSGESDQRA
jgi:hypothetical protein